MPVSSIRTIGSGGIELRPIEWSPVQQEAECGKVWRTVLLELHSHLERIIGLPRHEWNAALLRNLWPALNEWTMGRKLSVEHEEAWLTLAGFLLRPEFGFAHDGLRVDELWRLRDAGLCFPGKRTKVQEYILWRRMAGGLTAERQERLLAGEQASIRAGKAPPELVRLAGSLERLPRETKADLIQAFIAQVLHRFRMALAVSRPDLGCGRVNMVAM